MRKTSEREDSIRFWRRFSRNSFLTRRISKTRTGPSTGSTSNGCWKASSKTRTSPGSFSEDLRLPADGRRSMKSAATRVSGPLTGTAMALLAVALAAGGVGCGRRGPPLPPEQVDPEAPRLMPLRQEGGQVVIRWYAPRLSSGGDVEDLRLRRAIVSYRLVDIRELAAEERASQRAGPEEKRLRRRLSAKTLRSRSANPSRRRPCP